MSLVLTAVSVWRYLTIRSIFGTFAGLSEQSVSVIGGADGPTSIFVAGKVSQPLGLYAVTAADFGYGFLLRKEIQKIGRPGGEAPLSTAPDLSGFRCPGFHMIPHPRISGSGAGQIPCRLPPACPWRGWCRPLGHAVAELFDDLGNGENQKAGGTVLAQLAVYPGGDAQHGWPVKLIFRDDPWTHGAEAVHAFPKYHCL